MVLASISQYRNTLLSWLMLCVDDSEREPILLHLSPAASKGW